MNTSLYKFEGKYYLNIDLTSIEDVQVRKNIVSMVNEYLTRSKVTIYRLEEYGDVIMADHAFEQAIQYFG